LGPNGKQRPSRARIQIAQSAASPEEAAAIAAAIEQFLKDTAPRPRPPQPAISPWVRAALLENAGLDPAGPDHWASPARAEQPATTG